MAEAVGVDPRDARGPAEAWQKLFEPGSAACEEKLSHGGFGLSKRLRAIAITPSAWIWRQLLAATAWGRQPRFLIRDRDRSFGSDFVVRAAGIGITTVLTPVRAPNANAIAERVIGTLRRECLDHCIVINERHLRRLLDEYIQHYNAMRPHCSLALDAPEGRPRTLRFPGARLRKRAVLGGLHYEYRWAA